MKAREGPLDILVPLLLSTFLLQYAYHSSGVDRKKLPAAQPGRSLLRFQGQALSVLGARQEQQYERLFVKSTSSERSRKLPHAVVVRTSLSGESHARACSVLSGRDDDRLI